jgi:hypothetical protein
VACPSDEEHALKVEIIKDIVESRQYECHIALKRLDPGNFAFCTKICSKIIQSQFCIVLLDPSRGTKDCQHANANVNLEYGMMLSMNKHIIPLQEAKYTLPFNISPLDTVKYTQDTFKTKVAEAVNASVLRVAESSSASQPLQGHEVATFYNLEGFTVSLLEGSQFLQLLCRYGSHLGFYLFETHAKLAYRFVGAFEYEDPKTAVLNTKLLIHNIVTAYDGFLAAPGSDPEQFRYLTDAISIDVIVSPFCDKEEVRARIDSVAENKYGYPLRILQRSDIEAFVASQYKDIGEFKTGHAQKT